MGYLITALVVSNVYAQFFVEIFTSEETPEVLNGGL
jgi:hypothetical protein